MKKKFLVGLAIWFLMLGLIPSANAAVVDFTGGTAYTASGAVIGTTNNYDYWYNVGYYIESGIRYDFLGSTGGIAGLGIVGDYYRYGVYDPQNDVIHAHWESGLSAMKISMVDGSLFDLNYIDLTSNTITGGSLSTGAELSYITNDGSYSMLLPSSDWGFDKTFYNETGDGVVRLWLDSNFDDVAYVMFTSQNAYCFGLDNFYINEEAPPAVPEPSTILLLGFGLVGLVGVARKKMKK